jgi:glucosamine--fructose-6-phosphate aminotransferase (isomerizing)
LCGIIGIVSKSQVVSRLIDGLERLEYRGYDSAGVATINNSEIAMVRSTGKLISLKNRIKQKPINGFVGIGHTRWATHGEPVEINAHPHLTENVAVVHNGIIENFSDLKNDLLNKGVTFNSQTDTEVIAKLVEEKVSEENYKPLDAVRLSLEKLRGSFALCFIFKGFGNLVVAARRGSPLAIGFGEEENFVSSDAVSLSVFSKQICYLEEGDYAALSQDKVQIFDCLGNKVEREVKILKSDPVNLTKGKYKHDM